jgi:hypothetical protein
MAAGDRRAGEFERLDLAAGNFSAGRCAWIVVVSAPVGRGWRTVLEVQRFT